MTVWGHVLSAVFGPGAPKWMLPEAEIEGGFADQAQKYTDLKYWFPNVPFDIGSLVVADGPTPYWFVNKAIKNYSHPSHSNSGIFVPRVNDSLVQNDYAPEVFNDPGVVSNTGRLKRKNRRPRHYSPYTGRRKHARKKRMVSRPVYWSY